MHNEGTHNLHFSSNIIRMNASKRTRQKRHTGLMEERIKAYRISVGKPDSNRRPGRTRCMHMHSIKVDHQELWCDSEDRIHHLTQYSIAAGFCKHGSEPPGAIKLTNFVTS
jgi:hypothetical protein